MGVGGGPTLVYSAHSVKSTDIIMTNTYAGRAGDCVDWSAGAFECVFTVYRTTDVKGVSVPLCSNWLDSLTIIMSRLSYSCSCSTELLTQFEIYALNQYA